jgi:GAF domain-containing protein
VLEWIAPDAQESNATAVARCVAQGRMQDFESIYCHQDGHGRRVHILVNANVQRWGGTTRLVSYCRDITTRKQAEAALALRTTQLEAVRTVSMELTRTLEVVPLLHVILARAAELVGVRSAMLYRWEETTRELVATVRVGPSGATPPTRFRLGEAVAGAVALRREGFLVNDFRTSPYATSWFLEHTTHTAVLAEPLLSQDHLLGVIVLSNFAMPGHVFSAEGQDLLRLFAVQAAIAIQNAELFQASQRERREMEILADIARSINASLDLGRILQTVVEGARELTEADLGYVALRDAATDAMVFRCGAGAQYEPYTDLRVEPGKGVGGQVLSTGAPFRTAHYAEEPRITKDYLAVSLSEGVVAELAVPIRTAGRIEGLLYVANRSARPSQTPSVLVRRTERSTS